MDNDKIKKQKKGKPYVLIFFVLAALYLIWALIFGVALKGRASEIDHVVDCYIANSNVLFFTDPEPVVSSRYDSAAASDDLESFYNSAFLRLEYPDSSESQEIYATRLREALQVLYAQYSDGNIIIALHDYYATAAVYQLVYNTCEQVGLLINVGSYITNYADWNLIYINCFYETVTAWTRDLSNPTSTPTPTPALETFGFLGYFTFDSKYYYVEVSGNNLFGSVTLDVSNPDVAAAMAEVDTTDPNTIAGKSVYMVNSFSSGSSLSWLGPSAYLYFTGDNITVNVWRMSSSLISQDVSFIKENYSYVTLVVNNTNTSGIPEFTLYNVGDLNCLVIDYNYYRNTGIYRIVNAYGNNIDVLESYSSYLTAYNASEQLRRAYKSLLTYTEPPTPTPDPNASPAPSPQPTPTDMPQVIIHLPSGTPTPTAPVSFGPGDLPGSGGSAGGTTGSGLSGSELNTVLSFFKARLQNNQAIAFIAESFNVLPAELLWYFGFAIVIGICVRILWIFIFAKEG